MKSIEIPTLVVFDKRKTLGNDHYIIFNQKSVLGVGYDCVRL